MVIIDIELTFSEILLSICASVYLRSREFPNLEPRNKNPSSKIDI